MPTLRRILKYTLAVVLGLLIAAWVTSLFVRIGLTFGSAFLDYNIVLWLEPGNLVVDYPDDSSLPSDLLWFEQSDTFKANSVLGYLSFRAPFEAGVGRHVHVHFPLSLLITAMLPVAIGPFLAFRFRLWHYLAYTALIALELAYYLRWQE